jgi:hypothetical protein
MSEVPVGLQEFGDFSALDYSKPGYSVKFLSDLNLRPGMRHADIKDTIPKVAQRPDAVKQYVEKNYPEFNEFDRISVETRAIEGYFVPQVWGEIASWQKEFNAHFGIYVKTLGEAPIINGKVLKKIIPNGIDFENSDPIAISQQIQWYVSDFENRMVDIWGKKMNDKKDKIQFKKSADVRAYKRLEELAVQREIKNPKIKGRNLLGDIPAGMKVVLEQGRQIVWALFRTAYVMSEKHFRNLSPEERKQKCIELINSARALAFGIAGCAPGTARLVIKRLNHNLSTSGSGDVYDSECFSVLENRDKVYLEFNPEIFSDLAQEISKAAQLYEFAIRVRCPAVLTTDESNRNIVSAYYDRNAQCFIDFCLEK